MDRIYAGKELDVHTEESMKAIRETSNWEVYKYAKRDSRIALSVAVGCCLLFVGSFTALAMASFWASAGQYPNEQILPLIQLLTWLTIVFELLWLFVLFMAEGHAKRTSERWHELTQGHAKPMDAGELVFVKRRSRSILTLGVVALCVN